MEIVLYICASVALLALAGLFIFLIVFINGTKGLLGSVGDALKNLVTEIGAIRGSLQGTIKNLEGIVGKMEGTVDRVNAQLDQVEGIVESVKDVSKDVARLTGDATDVVHSAKNIVVSVIGFVDHTQQQIQKPVNEVMAILAAVSVGINKFRTKLGGDDDGAAHGGGAHDGAMQTEMGSQGRVGERSALANTERTAFIPSPAVSASAARAVPSEIYAE